MSLWQDPGAWLAIGVSALFVLAGFGLHWAFVRVLKAPPSDTSSTSERDSFHE